MKKLLALTVLILSASSSAFAVEGTGDETVMKRHGMMKNHMFNRFDTNRDGVITKEESAAENERMFNEVDADKDGKITRDEQKTFSEMRKAERQARRQEFLNKFDTNKNGKIDEDEKANIKKDFEARRAEKMKANETPANN